MTMKHILKTLFFLIFIAILSSCNQSSIQQQNTKPAVPYDPLKGLPTSQKNVLLREKQYSDMFTDAPNDIAKTDVQNKFNSWLKAYLIDTLKGDIKTWAVTVNDVQEGTLGNKNYVVADFRGYLPTGYEGLTLRLFQEIDYSTDFDISKSPLHDKIKDLKTDGAARLNAKLISLGDFYVSDSPNDLRFPEFNIKVDKVYQ